MVWHNNKLVNHDIAAKFRGFPPFFAGDRAQIIEFHFAVDNRAE